MSTKAPNEAFKYLEKNSLVPTVIKYVVDRNYRKSFDVAKWLKNCQIQDNTLDEIVAEIFATSEGKDHDDMVYKIFRWVKKNIEYERDQNVWKTIEYWQTPHETLEKRTGDCEDGAILTYALARYIGIPANRMMLICGSVWDPYLQGLGGHCWLAYRPQTDPWNLVYMDWCYYPTTKSVRTRPRFWFGKMNAMNKQKIEGQDVNYRSMWFGFNENRSYIRAVPTVQRNK